MEDCLELYIVKKNLKLCQSSALKTLYSIETHFDASATDSVCKTLWEKQKLLVTQSDNCSPILFIFLTSCLYLLLNWKSLISGKALKSVHFIDPEGS